MARKVWMQSPDSGGKKIPDAVKQRTENRIMKCAEEHFKEHYTRIELRFRGQFCYIDAYTDPEKESPDWPPPGFPESREEYIERMRKTPTYLCRLRYFGDEEQWGFAFYTYSNEKYELSMFPSGEFYGPPEDAFFVSANLYLQ
ncbi:hypothetical protein ISS30_00865 [bacterium]|nr:hypothetical protein [bacterium]